MQIPEYGKFSFHGIRNSGLWNSECSLRNTKSRIQHQESRLHGWESRIQYFIGFPYIGPIVDWLLWRHAWVDNEAITFYLFFNDDVFLKRKILKRENHSPVEASAAIQWPKNIKEHL